eukprot:10161249-Karenia_brevis.AAC.1
MVAGGMWPQEMLCQAGLSDTDSCQVCGETGTQHHRIYECMCNYWFRQHYGDPQLMHLAGVYKDWPLWTRSLLADPSWALPAPVLELQVA